MTDEEVAKVLGFNLKKDKDGALRYISEDEKSNLSLFELGKIKYLILEQVVKEQDHNYQRLLASILRVKDKGDVKIIEEVREYMKDQKNSVLYKNFEVKHHRKGKWTKEGKLI